MRARIWLLFYQTLTWFLLLTIRALLPLFGWTRPRFSKWFLMRFRPEPLTFQPRLWMHAVSLGEIQIALSLLEKLPHTNDILLTTATQSGFRFLTEKMGRQSVRYLPWDTGFCYKRLFGRFRVPHLVVVETELWPVLFRMVTAGGNKLVIVNGRLSARTLRLRKNPLFRETLSRVTRIAVRSDLDRERYLRFGVRPEQVAVTGNIKYDFKPKTLRADAFKAWLALPEPLLIFASISSDEVDLLVPEIKMLETFDNSPRLLWAPRHLKDLDIHLEALRPFDPVLRSKLGEEHPRLVVLDTFGELAGCYTYARLSLIGGSFNQRGGQNFLESLQAGTPAVMGPYTENFKREVAEAHAAKTILCLHHPKEVANTLASLLHQRENLKQMSERASAYLAKHSGAIARTVAVLVDLGIFDEVVLEDI